MAECNQIGEIWRGKKMKTSYAAITLLTTVLLTVATAFAQSPDRLPVTDAEKITQALRAAGAFITRDATVRAWRSAPGSQYRLLRRGSNEWTGLPAILPQAHDECRRFDPIFPSWIEDNP